MKIAIVGSGVSGLSAAYALHREHRVTVLEQEPVAGGHVATVAVEAEGGPIQVDTGFIVYNERTDRASWACSTSSAWSASPATCRSAQPATRAGSRSARGARGGSSRASDALRPTHWRMLLDVARFYREARRILDAPERSLATLGEWMDEHRYGRGFREHFLVPITSAVWSTAADRVLDFPVDYLLSFLDNHGLIGYGNAPQWRVISGGSQAYVARLVAALPPGSVRTGSQVEAVLRTRWGDHPDGGGAASVSNAVVMATTPTRPCACCSTPTIVSGTSLARSSTRRTGRPPHGRQPPACQPGARAPGTAHARLQAARRRPTMTYHMNRLQSIPGPVEYCVSLNPGDSIRPTG